jgi:hypothetical protein
MVYESVFHGVIFSTASPKKFYKKNGHLRIRVTDEINGVKIGSWISKQRQAYKKKTLSYSQIDKLNSIGMIWEVNHYKKRAA